MLKLDQISCRYGQVEVLHQVSLHLEQGEILGLLGRNGAGKTTLLKCLMGLLPLVSGKIVMNDEILSGKPAHEIPKKGIGLVPQGRGCRLRPAVDRRRRGNGYRRNARLCVLQGKPPVFAAEGEGERVNTQQRFRAA